MEMWIISPSAIVALGFDSIRFDLILSLSNCHKDAHTERSMPYSLSDKKYTRSINPLVQH